LNPAGADAVGALLVLLNLLERQSEGLTKFLLTHAHHQTAHAHAAADVPVNRIGRFTRHFQHSLGFAARSSFAEANIAVCRSSMEYAVNAEIVKCCRANW